MMEIRARPVSGVHVCDAFTFAIQNAAAAKSPRSRRASVDGSLFFVKGMPEKVLGECTTHIMPDGSAAQLTEEGRGQVLKQSRSMAAGGLRVLAMAYGSSLEDLTFAGIMGMEDPPREGVAECVRELRRGGVKVMMVTGDSKETALAIARRCGILGSEHEDAPKSGGLDDLLLTQSHETPHSSSESPFHDLEYGASVAMSGTELDSIPVQNLPTSLTGVRVFYRVVPR
jgi:Ca2+-transporting ATPase